MTPARILSTPRRSDVASENVRLVSLNIESIRLLRLFAAAHL